MKQITAKIIAETFNIKILNKKEISTFLNITSPAIYRSGLELLGYGLTSKRKNLITWGTKEVNFFKKLGEQKVYQLINNLFQTQPPGLILSVSFSRKWERIILKLANVHGVPVMKSATMHTAEITSDIGSYLTEHFAPAITVHGSLVVIDGVGVLITGKPGIGKSEAILELVQGGEQYVADDSTVIKKIGNKFLGSASPITRDFLEVRGLGIIDIKTIYGTNAVKDEVTIQLVTHLSEPDKEKDFDRLGNQVQKYNILNGAIPLIKIPVLKGRTVAAIIRAAVALFIAKKNGHFPLETLKKRSLTKENKN